MNDSKSNSPGQTDLLATLLNQLPQMVWIRGLDGSKYTNPRLDEYFGSSKPTYDLESWLHVIHPEDRARARSHWDEFIKDGKNYEVRLRICRNVDKTYRWLIVRVFAIRDNRGAITHFGGTLMDVHALEHSVRRMQN
ncbi:MAG: PAS domain-containing protein, partial [Proteobacteria bacterium]